MEVTHTGQELTVDGVRIVFQLAPGTEAPSEMYFFFPDRRALCMAENATHTLHDILTIRGAVVREPHGWAQYLSEAIERFGADTDAVFASHHWPTWGRERAIEFLAVQRDLYAYLHDQTLRLLNQGLTGAEIAEDFPLPPALEKAWHAHGYYGSVSHNVKAIYQRYLGWYDGNPAGLWPHPPQAAGQRYVQFMGGADAVVEKARASFDEGDFRRVAQVLDHVVSAEPKHTGARALFADALEQLGFGSENGTWRNAYLSGAMELRAATSARPSPPRTTFGPVDPRTVLRRGGDPGQRAGAWDLDLAIGWTFPTSGQRIEPLCATGAQLLQARIGPGHAHRDRAEGGAGSTGQWRRAGCRGRRADARGRWWRTPTTAVGAAARRPQLQHHRALTHRTVPRPAAAPNHRCVDPPGGRDAAISRTPSS